MISEEDIGEKVVIIDEDEKIGYGILEEIDIDISKRKAIFHRMPDGSLSDVYRHQPSVSIPDGMMMKRYPVQGELCMVRNHAEVHLAPAGAIHRA